MLKKIEGVSDHGDSLLYALRNARSAQSKNMSGMRQSIHAACSEEKDAQQLTRDKKIRTVFGCRIDRRVLCIGIFRFERRRKNQ